MEEINDFVEVEQLYCFLPINLFLIAKVHQFRH